MKRFYNSEKNINIVTIKQCRVKLNLYHSGYLSMSKYLDVLKIQYNYFTAGKTTNNSLSINYVKLTI